MWIAATALRHGLALFSYDGHFQAVDGLVVGSRLADFVFRSVCLAVGKIDLTTRLGSVG